MRRSFFVSSFAKSCRGASKETVITIISVGIIALAVLAGSYEKEDSYHEFKDNGKIFLVGTKHWGE